VRTTKTRTATKKKNIGTGDLAERAQRAVEKACRAVQGANANPIFTEEMFGLLQEQDANSDDPLCLFRYFTPMRGGEWYVYAADRLGPKATNMLTGGSAAGHIQFWAFACLGDPTLAEAGLVPLDKANGMGLRDIPPIVPGLAAVELDRNYVPERISQVSRRITGREL
jgi:hypothetical protein